MHPRFYPPLAVTSVCFHDFSLLQQGCNFMGCNTKYLSKVHIKWIHDSQIRSLKSHYVVSELEADFRASESQAPCVYLW